MSIMNYDQFSNISCYEEFEMKCILAGISKIRVLYKIGYLINDYFFFISNDGIFNWFDLKGNHIEDPHVLKDIKHRDISKNIIKCVIPNSVMNIMMDAFSYCKSLKEIIIPNSVIYIGKYAFYNCESLTSITIPDSVKSIDSFAFYNCESLKEIIIPDSISDIGVDVFYGCESLKEVIFKGKTLDDVKQMQNYPFGIKDENIIKCEK